MYLLYTFIIFHNYIYYYIIFLYLCYILKINKVSLSLSLSQIVSLKLFQHISDIYKHNSSEFEKERFRMRSVTLWLLNWLCNKNDGYKLITRVKFTTRSRSMVWIGGDECLTSFTGSSRDRARRRRCLVFLTRGQPADQPACHLPKDNNVVILPWDTDEVLNNPINPRYILHINICRDKHVAAIHTSALSLAN